MSLIWRARLAAMIHSVYLESTLSRSRSISGLMTISGTSFVGSKGFDDADQHVGGPGNIIVFYHMIVCFHKPELPHRRLQTSLHLLVGLRSARADPAFQLLHRRRDDEHQHRLGHQPLDLQCTLRIDLKHHVHAPGELLLHCGRKRSVEVPVHLSPLEELAHLHARPELLRAEEVVLSPLGLTGSWRTRGGRDGGPKMRNPGHQAVDQSSFTGARGPGDDDERASPHEARGSSTQDAASAVRADARPGPGPGGFPRSRTRS